MLICLDFPSVIQFDRRKIRLQGIQELYEFCQSNPNVSMDAYFKNSSTNFREYVERSLAKIAATAETKSSTVNRDAPATSGNGPLPSITTSAASDFLARLQSMRSKIGLEPVPVVLSNGRDPEQVGLSGRSVFQRAFFYCNWRYAGFAGSSSNSYRPVEKGRCCRCSRVRRSRIV